MAEVVEWIDSTGAVHSLTDPASTVRLLRGRHGLFMPPIGRTEDEVPGRPGTRLRAIKHKLREVAIPVRFKEASETALRTTMRAWAGYLDPALGDGQLRITSVLGDQRILNCRYDGGYEVDESEGSGFHPGMYQKAVWVFKAADPYWYDATDIVTDFTVGTAATFFPIFPLSLSSSEVFAASTINNTGDVLAWPVVTFQGPGNTLAARNITTGKYMVLTNNGGISLALGESITVDTRQDLKAVTKQDGTNYFSRLTSDSSLWALAKGNNDIQLEMAGATASSRIRVAYRRGFHTP